MLPNPLHPAVVHFPVVLAVLMPLVILVATVAIRRGFPARQTWGAVLALQLFLVLSSWVAMETGEKEEEKVEEVVAEQAIEAHEEAAELFIILTGVTLLVAGAGLLSGGKGEAGRYAALVASLVVLGAGARVGHLGGELVYKHGAAQAYVQSGGGAALEAGEASEGEQSEDAASHEEHEMQEGESAGELQVPADPQATSVDANPVLPVGDHDEAGEHDGDDKE